MYCRDCHKTQSLCGIVEIATDFSTDFSYRVTCPALLIGPSEQSTKCVWVLGVIRTSNTTAHWGPWALTYHLALYFFQQHQEINFQLWELSIQSIWSHWGIFIWFKFVTPKVHCVEFFLTINSISMAKVPSAILYVFCWQWKMSIIAATVVVHSVYT